jgi:uncharacterized protein (DUF2141 family)
MAGGVHRANGSSGAPRERRAVAPGTGADVAPTGTPRGVVGTLGHPGCAPAASARARGVAAGCAAAVLAVSGALAGHALSGASAARAQDRAPAGERRPDAGAGATSPAGPGRLTAEVRTAHDRGLVVCALFRSARGFPDEAELYSAAFTRVRPRDRKALCVFEAVPPGTYAISVFHDEDGDGRLARGAFGIPSEGWGTSRNASAALGPPSFGDAKFRHPGGDVRLREPIRLRY